MNLIVITGLSSEEDEHRGAIILKLKYDDGLLETSDNAKKKAS